MGFKYFRKIFSTHTAAVKRKASLHNEKTDAMHRFFWRRHPDLNRGIKVLQTSALPLGYVAVLAGVAGFEPAHDGIRIRCLTAWRYPNNFKWGG